MRMALLGMAVAVFALAALDYGVTAVIEFSQIPTIVRLEATLNTTIKARASFVPKFVCVVFLSHPRWTDRSKKV